MVRPFKVVVRGEKGSSFTPEPKNEAELYGALFQSITNLLHECYESKIVVAIELLEDE